MKNNKDNVIDPHGNKQKYQNWKDKGKPLDTSKKNRELILEFINDFELGINVNKSRGGRSENRLNSLRSRMTTISNLFEKKFNKNLDELNERDCLNLFKDLKESKITKPNGNKYGSIKSYSNVFGTFWHWYQKKSLVKDNKEILDITRYLSVDDEKPKFNYITLTDLKKMVDEATFKYKTMMWFMFDTGIRPPSELCNVKVSDINYDDKTGNFHLQIREETSKTFGRKIKLLLCGDIVKRYIKRNKLKKDDYLFKICPKVVNQYLKRLGKIVLNIDNLTMYDFRHSSACHWQPKYKQESAMKYRFGWKKSNMIHYYTEFLGMKDTITEDDLIDSEDKKLLEKELDKQRQVNTILQERLSATEKTMEKRFKDMEDQITKQRIKRFKDGNKEEVLKELIGMIEKNPKKKFEDLLKTIRD